MEIKQQIKHQVEKKIANYMLSREVKPNFKEMEKSSECQKDFSMHYSSLA